MEYKINQKVLWECLEIMEMQDKKMKLCYEELERLFRVPSEENKNFRKDLKDMEEQMQELWKLRRILERVLVNEEWREQKILEQLEGKQKQKNNPAFGKITLGHLSEIMEDLQIWIQ